MSILPEFQERLRKGFPPASDSAVIRAVQEGVWLADDAIANTPFLNTPIGRDIRGLIRRAGVIYRVKDKCDKGDIPFEAVITVMPFGHWHWLEIQSNGTHAHVCRTEKTDAFPEDTPNRQDARLVNQGDLFRWSGKLLPISGILNDIDSLYTWLMTGIDGDGRLTHLCWGCPAGDGNTWLAFANILREAGAQEFEQRDPRTPDPRDRMRFHEHIQEIMEKNDEIRNIDKPKK